MKILAAILVVLVAGPALAVPPPDHLPRIVRGQVVNGLPATMPTTQPAGPSPAYGYAAVWNDQAGGYVFQPPGRPAGWDLITSDAAGVVTIGGVSADWSFTAIGVPLVEPASGFAFIPDAVEFGYAWSPRKLSAAFGGGFLLGFGLDLFAFFMSLIGGFVSAPANAIGGRHLRRRV